MVKAFKNKDKSWCRICTGTFPPDMMWSWEGTDDNIWIGPISHYCAKSLRDALVWHFGDARGQG